MSVDVAGQPSPKPVEWRPEERPSVEVEQPQQQPPPPQAQPRPGRKRRSRLVQLISVAGLIILLVLLWRIFSGKTDKAAGRNRGEQAVPVEMVAATQKDIPIQIKGIGNVEALSTISVRSEIEGTLQSVFFTPGQEVRKNDLLFRIDPRPLEAALNTEESNLLKAVAAVKQGEAVVAKDQATATNSRIYAGREAKLLENGVIARQDYDNAASKAQSDEAVVKADQEAVDNLQAAVKAQQAVVANARVQLSYTEIRAPISGKTGNLEITAGNLVQPNSTTPLITITQTAPIYVTFSVPQQELDQIRKYHAGKELTVQAAFPGDEANPATGRLSLVDNTVDPTTGTIKLKATFENGDHKLFPGQFVNVVLTLGMESNATVVPSQAVQIGQDQQFVYVLKSDMTVEVRKVKTGDSLENITVIEEGLNPGEQVVTDGQLSLTPGAKVQSKADQASGAGDGGDGGGQGGRQGGGRHR